MSRDGSYFVIVNQCESPKFGCAEEFGPLVRVNADQMARDGLDMILCSVELYPKRRKTEKSELEALPRAEQAKFDCEHKHVSLSLRENELG